MSTDKKTPATSGSPLDGLRKSRGISGFFQDVMREMKHVTWPTQKETMRMTGTVLAVCAILAVTLYLLSEAFRIVLSILIGGGA